MIAIMPVDPPPTAAQATLLAALHAACFARAWSADEIGTLLAMPGAFAGVASRAGTPAGFHLCRAAGTEAEIISIGVDPARRRTGTGRALVADVFSQAQRLGATTVFIEVASDNAAALALYRQAGFSQVGRRPDYYPAGSGARDALVMRAVLGRSSDAE